jgi:hypothetical protein
MGWTALVSLPLMSFLSGVPHRRAPLPGELFYPADLVSNWWRVMFWGALGIFAVSAIAWRILRSSSGPTPRREARLEVDDVQLRVTASGDRTRHVDLTDIEHVFDDEAKGATMVRLRGGEMLAIEGEDPRVRARLATLLIPNVRLHAARAPIGSAASTFGPLRKLSTTFFVVSYIALLVMLLLVGEALFQGAWSSLLARLPYLVATVATATASWPLLRPREVVVAADGVRIDGLLRRRYVPLDSIWKVEARDDGGVTLTFFGGKTRVEIPGRADGGGLAGRIMEALRARNDARLAPVEVRGLARDGRKLVRWRDELKRLTDASYRNEAVRIADLETVLGNPTADPEQRVAAAVALSHDDAAKKRIRIVAAACADPDLETALEAAAEGELDAARLRKARKRFRDAPDPDGSDAPPSG